MVRRQIIVEELTADERCLEMYGVAKQGLLNELSAERRSLRRSLNQEHVIRMHGTPRPVPGPTLQAMIYPEFRRYIEDS